MADVIHLPWRSGQPIPAADDRDWVTSAELVAAAGITYRQVDYWTRTGLLVPIDEATPGSGHLRRYGEGQVVRARALSDLLEAGIALQTCRDVVDELVRDGQVTVGRITFTRPLTEVAS